MRNWGSVDILRSPGLSAFFAFALLMLDQVLAALGRYTSGPFLQISASPSRPDTLLPWNTPVVFAITAFGVLVAMLIAFAAIGRSERKPRLGEMTNMILCFTTVLAALVLVYSVNRWAESQHSTSIAFWKGDWEVARLNYTSSFPLHVAILVYLQMVASAAVGVGAIRNIISERGVSFFVGIALGLLSGGALADFFDRLVLLPVGGLADDGLSHFPTMNTAQASIALATVILVCRWLWMSNKAQRKALAIASLPKSRSCGSGSTASVPTRRRLNGRMCCHRTRAVEASKRGGTRFGVLQFGCAWFRQCRPRFARAQLPATHVRSLRDIPRTSG